MGLKTLALALGLIVSTANANDLPPYNGPPTTDQQIEKCREPLPHPELNIKQRILTANKAQRMRYWECAFNVIVPGF